MDWLKWLLVASFALMLLAAAGVAVYIITPLIISSLMGVPAACEPPSGISAAGAQANIAASLYSLCATAKSLLGLVVLLLITIAAVPALIAALLASYEVVASPAATMPMKIALPFLFIIFPGVVAVAVYYFTLRKSVKCAGGVTPPPEAGQQAKGP